jgi:hypothetical protein
VDKNERYQEALVALKTSGFNQKAVLLIDRDMEALLVAWPFIVKTVEDRRGVDLEAWDFVDFDMVEWMDMAGLRLSAEEMDFLFLRIKNMKLVYPDGTYPDEVDRYLMRLAAGRIGDD